MAYLHCPSCDWSQDDFWDTHYNPFNYLKDLWEEPLLNRDLEKPYGKTGKTIKEVMIDELKMVISSISKMKYRTPEEYEKNNPEHLCPTCGEELCID